MKKKLLLLTLLVVMMLALTGCFEMESTFKIDSNGKADVKLVIRADDIMAGDELSIYGWGLINTFPELRENYTITKEERTVNYTTYLYYIFETKEPIDISRNENITFKKDGEQYIFKMDIPPLVDTVSEDTKDTLAFTFTVHFPEEIDMANSRNVHGNQVSWKVYYEDLLEGTTLKAYTK